jgi:hypothetical protein
MSRSSQTKVFLNLIWYESLLRSVLNNDQSHQCCGTVTIFYGSGSGSGSDF